MRVLRASWTLATVAACVVSFVATAVASANDAAASAPSAKMIQAMEDLIHALRAGDDRLFPWDVSPETAEQQAIICPKALPDAIAVLVTSLPTTKDKVLRRDALQLKSLAATLCALCFTDNFAHRALLSSDSHPQVYQAVVEMLAVSNYSKQDTIIEPEDYEVADAAAAAAAHLIWIAVFGNAANHAGFVKAGAVAPLGHIVVAAHAAEEKKAAEESFPIVILPATVMWAAAALQNLAASYCGSAVVVADKKDPDTLDGDAYDPRCYWDWTLNETTHLHTLDIAEDSGKVVIDATDVRKAMIATPELVDSLLEWTCRGPVHGENSVWNPYPGETAVIKVRETFAANMEKGNHNAEEDELPDRHETSMNLVHWAAAGALKNIVLDPAARSRVDPDLSCFCWLQRSRDWLEANKGEGLLHHLRPSNPCWFESDEVDDEEEGGVGQRSNYYLCVDSSHFFDAQHNSCEEMTSPELCEKSVDVATGTTASAACCACGGGHVDSTSQNSLRAAAGGEEDEDEDFEEEL